MAFIELTLQAPDPAALRGFYEDVLGLPVMDEPGGSLAIQVGATRLRFEPAPAGMDPRYHFAINIPHNQFAEARAWLLDRGPLLLRDGVEDVLHFEPWNADACYFADPAGNILELIARHNLPNESDHPFGSAGFLCVCEIGVPGPTVRHVVDALEAGPGLVVWSGDCEIFAAVGDEQGLFICVPQGHMWLPDARIPATPYPVQAVIPGAQDATFTVPDLPYTIKTVPVN